MTKPFRIAFNAMNLPANMAGIGHYTRMLVRHLLKLEPGLEITLYTNASAAPGFSDLPDSVRIRAFAAGSIAMKTAASQFLLPFYLGRHDVVHSVGNVAVMACPIPQVVTLHDFCQRVFPERFGMAKRAYLNLGQSLTAMKDVRIICVSESTRNDAERFHPRLRGKITTVHSASKFEADAVEAGPRRDALFVGTLEPGKNLETALAALDLLRREHGMVKRLKVVGAKGWKQSHIPSLIASLGLEDQVLFQGYLDDDGLRRIYKESECLVFPSVYEGFGLPILEAQSQGCPVMAADNSSLREVGGEGCLYFQAKDSRALAGLLASLDKDEAVSAGLRDRGFENLRRFDWDLTARKTLVAYWEAAGRG